MQFLFTCYRLIGRLEPNSSTGVTRLTHVSKPNHVACLQFLPLFRVSADSYVIDWLMQIMQRSLPDTCAAPQASF
jgi:hypothetical protein